MHRSIHFMRRNTRCVNFSPFTDEIYRLYNTFKVSLDNSSKLILERCSLSKAWCGFSFCINVLGVCMPVTLIVLLQTFVIHIIYNSAVIQ